LAENGRKAEKYPSVDGRIQQDFAATRARNEPNGYSITVGFTEKGFYLLYLCWIHATHGKDTENLYAVARGPFMDAERFFSLARHKK
jgi:hypothetical protein